MATLVHSEVAMCTKWARLKKEYKLFSWCWGVHTIPLGMDSRPEKLLSSPQQGDGWWQEGISALCHSWLCFAVKVGFCPSNKYFFFFLVMFSLKRDDGISQLFGVRSLQKVNVYGVQLHFILRKMNFEWRGFLFGSSFLLIVCTCSYPLLAYMASRWVSSPSVSRLWWAVVSSLPYNRS